MVSKYLPLLSSYHAAPRQVVTRAATHLQPGSGAVFQVWRETSVQSFYLLQIFSVIPRQRFFIQRNQSK